ncbi:MAG: response regulator [Cyanobacteria bacterium P01_H01_bin.15]
MPVTVSPKTIFLVEDNLGDIRLIQEALKEAQTPCEIVVARDGVAAISQLQQPGVPLPDLILLDLNLPKKDGRQVLAELKADPRLQTIPVIVLTTSRNEEDITHSYDLHANCYIAKSRNLRELFKIIRGIEAFWLETATLPQSPSAFY